MIYIATCQIGRMEVEASSSDRDLLREEFQAGLLSLIEPVHHDDVREVIERLWASHERSSVFTVGPATFTLQTQETQ